MRNLNAFAILDVVGEDRSGLAEVKMSNTSLLDPNCLICSYIRCSTYLGGPVQRAELGQPCRIISSPEGGAINFTG